MPLRFRTLAFVFYGRALHGLAPDRDTCRGSRQIPPGKPLKREDGCRWASGALLQLCLYIAGQLLHLPSDVAFRSQGRGSTMERSGMGCGS